jgi:hypothetical protein
MFILNGKIKINNRSAPLIASPSCLASGKAEKG